MKSIAIIIANTEGLPGVDVDIKNITSFLTSVEGGAWHENDIITLKNSSRESIKEELSTIKNVYDFVIVFFTGHGGQNKKTDLLFINGKNEYIKLEDINNLAFRQINIIDCCRSEVKDKELSMLSESSIGLESYPDDRFDKPSARLEYARRIMESSHQQVTLYACSENEYSAETKNGGLYMSSLINKASNFKKIDDAFMTVLSTHTSVASEVTSKAQSLGNKQNPDYASPRLPENEQLVISINPRRSAHTFR
ncbi:caspase family protein [Pectobacterium polaris]|uniref:caspase family protein n=1 Tax=Pectobacterium polaris TaxID=2042057 RepID=UPI002406593D|nr:caspase family protein [Pectobacterium polaris]MDG0801441.1 caspase family protein [Pectobacterium polaris]